MKGYRFYTVCAASLPALLLGCALWLAPLHASGQIFMKFEGPKAGAEEIKGEATAKEFKDHIEIQSVQFGVGNSATFSSRAGTGSGIEAGKASFSEITITKASDLTSPLLMKNVAIGGYYDTVRIEFATPNAQNLEVYQKIEIKNVIVTGFSQSSGGDRPTESLSLAYGGIRMTSIGDPGGSAPITVEREWNIITNKGTLATTRQDPLGTTSAPAVTGSDITVKP